MTTASPSPKVALVTGASSGMGKDFALRLKQDGLIVYAAARRVDTAFFEGTARHELGGFRYSSSIGDLVSWSIQ